MVPDPEEADWNEISTQGATSNALRKPNWKMWPTLQGLPLVSRFCGKHKKRVHGVPTTGRRRRAACDFTLNGNDLSILWSFKVHCGINDVG